MLLTYLNEPGVLEYALLIFKLLVDNFAIKQLKLSFKFKYVLRLGFKLLL